MRTLHGIILGMAAAALLLAPLPIQAATYDLSATAGTVVMPDGAAVPVWGLVEGTNLPLTPVPVLTETAGNSLVINLANQLPEPVSLVINGQGAQGGMTPVFFADADGRQRVRSFTHEAGANGGTATYTWPDLKPGTYLISSGTHPAVQVPMGLYAVLKVEAAAGEAYPGQTFTRDLTLLFSELDPVLNQAVASGIYGDPAGAYPTSLKVGYSPKYFLLNGRPWTASAPALANLTAGDVVLLRMLNAGLRPRTPILPGQALTMIAEDGNPYSLDFQPTQSSADLVAGKTLDALLTIAPPTDPPAADIYLPLHDRMLGLAGGGMFGTLVVGTSETQLTVAVAGPGRVSSTSLPGGIADCTTTTAGGLNCTAGYLSGTAVTLRALPDGLDSALTGWSVSPNSDPAECTTLGDCVVTLDQAKTVTATFSTFPALALVTPNGGEQFPFDATLPIRWVAPDNPADPDRAFTFDIGCSQGPGSPFRLIANRVAGREFLWNPAADNLRPSAGVRLAIISYDAAGQIVGRDTSDAPFTLVAPLQLTYPNGTAGEPSVVAGAPLAITWNVRLTEPAAYRASLWYQTAPTAPWGLIADVDPALGTYPWTAPSALTGTARIALTLYDGAGNAIATDTSDAPFGIGAAPGILSASALETAPAPRAALGTSLTSAAEADPAPAPAAAGEVSDLLLLLPNGGEVLAAETHFIVLWQASAAAASFALDYSLDGGENWRSLARDLDDTQFDWVIDAGLRGSRSVLLRVTAFGAEGEILARDLADEPFVID